MGRKRRKTKKIHTRFLRRIGMKRLKTEERSALSLGDEPRDKDREEESVD